MGRVKFVERIRSEICVTISYGCNFLNHIWTDDEALSCR